MRNLRLLWISIILCLLTGSCSLIYELDLSDEVVTVIMPVDGSVSEQSTQLFWWESMIGATEYNFRMVEGSFRDPRGFVCDTYLTEDKYEITLDPGEYEWRIQARNNYSESIYCSGFLTIVDNTTNEE